MWHHTSWLLVMLPELSPLAKVSKWIYWYLLVYVIWYMHVFVIFVYILIMCVSISLCPHKYMYTCSAADMSTWWDTTHQPPTFFQLFLNTSVGYIPWYDGYVWLVIDHRIVHDYVMVVSTMCTNVARGLIIRWWLILATWIVGTCYAMVHDRIWLFIMLHDDW